MPASQCFPKLLDSQFIHLHGPLSSWFYLVIINKSPPGNSTQNNEYTRRPIVYLQKITFKNFPLKMRFPFSLYFIVDLQKKKNTAAVTQKTIHFGSQYSSPPGPCCNDAAVAAEVTRTQHRLGSARPGFSRGLGPTRGKRRARRYWALLGSSQNKSQDSFSG